MSGFTIVVHRVVREHDLPKLDPETRKRIFRAINFRLSASPEVFGKPLASTMKGLWSLRVGDWRVIYKIEKSEVWILRVRHRREVYKSTIPEIE